MLQGVFALLSPQHLLYLEWINCTLKPACVQSLNLWASSDPEVVLKFEIPLQIV